MSWGLIFCDEATSRLRKFSKSKKWSQEILNIAENLQTLLNGFNNGVSPEASKRLFPCVHGNYDLGILSIDERGPRGKAKPKPFRLYVYPDSQEEDLYVLTFGEKKTQERDVKLSRNFVAGLLQSRELEIEPDINSSEQVQE